MSYHQSQNQGFGQPFILPQADFQRRTNEIIDQREYNYQGFRQTSEGQQDNYQVKRSAPPKSFAVQPNIEVQANVQGSTVTPVGPIQSQTPGPNNFQSQSIFQSTVANKTPAQSQIGINNQVGFQNQPISQSFVPPQKATQSEINKPIQQNQQNEVQFGLSQQLTFQQRDINAQNRPQSANQNAQSQLGFGQSSRIDNNFVNERPSNNNILASNNNFQNPPQQKFGNDGGQSQRNNSQIYINNNLAQDNYNQRAPAAPQSNSNLGYQQEQQQQQQLDHTPNNADYRKQGSQFPPSQSYYNSSLLQDFKPVVHNQDDQQSTLNLYAQFFQVCGYQLDTQIGDEQALEVLNTSQAQFDLEVLQQIKDELKSQNSYTVREFLEVYIKAIAVLDDRGAKEESMIQVAKDKLNELIQLQEQARINEQNNPGQQSTLYVQVQQAKGLDRQSHYIVRLNFDYNQQTETTRSTYSSEPTFNEEFKLKINNANSILTFSVVDATNGRTVGYVTQKLKQFFHQKKIDEWYILEDQGGALGDISKQICIAIQWIHSERQYYENILRENDYFEPIIKEQEEKLNDTIDLLRILRFPFERDLEAFRQEIEDAQQEKRKKSKKRSKPGPTGESQQEPSAIADCWTSCMGIFDSDDEESKPAPKKQDAPIVVTGADNFNSNPQANVNVNAGAQQTANLQKSQVNPESTIHFKDNLVYAYVIFAALICFWRPNFIDLVLAIVLVSNLIKLNPSNCNKICIAILVTIFIDILWMALFTSSWFSYAPSSVLNMTLFLIVEIIATMLKVIICIVLQKIKSDQPPTPSVQQHGAQNKPIPHNQYYQNL